MRHLSRETREDPREVIAAATNHLPEAAANKMPNVPNMKRTVQRIRMRHNGPARQPATLADLVIPDNLAQFDDGEQFLIHDSGAEDGNQR